MSQKDASLRLSVFRGSRYNMHLRIVPRSDDGISYRPIKNMVEHQCHRVKRLEFMIQVATLVTWDKT